MYVCVIKMSDVIPILAIVIIAYLRFSTTFILQNDCLVSSPCTCFDSYDGIDIRCSSTDLTTITDIKQFSANVDKINLYFSYNKLTVIQNDTFRNLSSINANDIDLQLQGNMIHRIESNAFNGIAKTIKSLQLQSNNITILPLAIKYLVNLKSLDICDNPLHSLDTLVMHNIGRSLTYFSFDLDTFTEWPKELHYLRVLESLIANHIPYPQLDVNVFHGFEILDYTRLDHVPVAVTFLTKLRYLKLSGRPIDCTCDMSYLKHWNVSSVNTFSTKCASSSETVKHFIMTFLQSCQ
ncbi:uncharacterized protein LOC132758013 isoform X2 [Ruditapes philippinarum]|uniref:uncharacterized protein LOC132758013 isoform X2 n=1 Tax=Ruditapes philippinarum TaxID=129788 RepID=UPI00295AB046|nr:uncharacterized protein LOC132758013 isoform X2 [Ruditapes philippinarum]